MHDVLSQTMAFPVDKVKELIDEFEAISERERATKQECNSLVEKGSFAPKCVATGCIISRRVRIWLIKLIFNTTRGLR